LGCATDWLAAGPSHLPRAAGAPAATAPSPEVSSPVPARNAEQRAPSAVKSPADVEKIASYRLQARLEDKDHRVIGRGTIRWKNASEKPAEELYFHLYLEAFRSERSLLLRAPHRRSRTGSGLGRAGGLEIEHLRSPRYKNVDL